MTLEQKYAFFYKVMQGLGLQPSINRMEFFLVWAAIENTQAKNNPLATTWDMEKVDPGQTTFNSAKVRNYSSEGIGVKATVNTIRLKYYTPIVDALKADKSIHSLSPSNGGLIQAFKTWGGTQGYWPAMTRIAASAPGEQIASFVKKNSQRAPQTAGLKFWPILLIAAAVWLWPRK